MFPELLRKLLTAVLPPAPVYYIGGSDVLPPPLDRAAEAETIAALSSGDGMAKNRLIEHNLRLVVYIARRFENAPVGLEDLISIGTIGLIKPWRHTTAKKTSSWPPMPADASKTKS